MCRVYVVADYLYYMNIGGGNIHKTAGYIVSINMELGNIHKNSC